MFCTSNFQERHSRKKLSPEKIVEIQINKKKINICFNFWWGTFPPIFRFRYPWTRHLTVFFSKNRECNIAKAYIINALKMSRFSL